MKTSRAFDIQEKRGSAVNAPPNIQRSGSLLHKHSSSESDLEPTEMSWKSHKNFFFSSLRNSSVLVQFEQGAKICILSHFTRMCWPIPPFLVVQTATCCESWHAEIKRTIFNVWELFARYFLSGFDES